MLRRRKAGPRGDKGDGRTSPGPGQRVDIHRLASNLRTEECQASCRDDEREGALLAPMKAQDTQWDHLAGDPWHRHGLVLVVISLSHGMQKTHWGLGEKYANNSNSYNLTVMSKPAMKTLGGFSLPQTGTLCKIDPHAKPF